MDHWTNRQRRVANMQKAEKTRSDCGVCGFFVEFVSCRHRRETRCAEG